MKAASFLRTSPLVLALAALAALSPLARAQAVKDLPQPTDYVSDFAHVLSPEATAHLDALCLQLDQAAHAKVAIVTVQTMNGDDSADYANQLEDHWKMGDKTHQGENRFALILVAVGDHKYRIETGYGLEGILPDGKVGDIGRSMVPDLRANDYDGAITLAVGQIAQVIADDAHITLDQNPAPDVPPAQVQRRGSEIGKLIFLLLILLLFAGGSLFRILFGASLFFGGWGGRGPWGGGGFGGGGFGSGGGGFSGFGGGGGGFGGGGAGGSW
jgi:uncharacterized protein